MTPPSGQLFGPALPDGFVYDEGFLSPAEEADVVRGIAGIEFATFEMRGVAARRRVAFFGASYARGGTPPPPMPPFLTALRDRVADWSRIDAAAFAMALINEYPPGAPIGWHRDAPQYDVVAGISLLSACRMKFRPYQRPGSLSPATKRTATHDIVLEPRSIYLMAGEARHGYEHHIPAVERLRYSVTFRTERAR